VAGPERSRPTLEMVAAAAGVGRGTASRVLNGAPNVSPHAVRAVTDAARRLGYRPNFSARSLVTGRTGLVGLVVDAPASRVFGDPYFALVLAGIHEVLAAADTSLVLALLEDERERNRLLHATAGRLDGVLVVHGHGDHRLVDGLTGLGLPVVYAGRTPVRGTSTLSWVDGDNLDGALQAVRHLVDRGRRGIATITGPQDMAAGLDRLRGWRTAMREAGLPTPPGRVAQGDYTEGSGERAMRALLERDPDLDAVFAANDLMAIGAVRVLQAAGRRVPQDVAVVGFDDNPAAAALTPALTTVAQPVPEMGREMARALLALLQGDTLTHQIVMPTRLIVRESS
jgi:DNA-binding LacI/PurR family transcriptional regulator